MFGSFRAALDAEMRPLHSLGLGSTTKQVQPITADEDALLCKLVSLIDIVLLVYLIRSIIVIAKYLVCVVMMNTEFNVYIVQEEGR